MIDGSTKRCGQHPEQARLSFIHISTSCCRKVIRQTGSRSGLLLFSRLAGAGADLQQQAPFVSGDCVPPGLGGVEGYG